MQRVLSSFGVTALASCCCCCPRNNNQRSHNGDGHTIIKPIVGKTFGRVRFEFNRPWNHALVLKVHFDTKRQRLGRQQMAATPCHLSWVSLGMFPKYTRNSATAPPPWELAFQWQLVLNVSL